MSALAAGTGATDTDSGESHDGCYHCGSPVPRGFDASLRVFGTPRMFCCHGCLAVCGAILDAGLADYYRHRETEAVRASTDGLSKTLSQLRLYDHPRIQESFVRAEDDWREAWLVLENIRCQACLWLNEQHLRRLPGIVDANIDYASQHARVRWVPSKVRLSDILKAISDIGYIAHPYDPSRRQALLEDQRRRSGQRLLFAGVVGMIVMQFALGTYLLGQPDEKGMLPLWVLVGRWTSLLAVTALLVYPAQDFFVGAWRDLRAGRLGMDVPIVLGLLAAYTGSVLATLKGTGEVYYDSIAMFVFLLLLARFFEFKSRVRAADVLDRLSRIVPRVARRLTSDGQAEEVPVVNLRPGDRIQVLPGETVPVDAVIAEGWSTFDESVLTGESLPVKRLAGAAVPGGCCNVDQPVVLRVSRRGMDSAPAEMTRLLERALRARPAYALLADKAAVVFVAVVLVLAGTTAAFWLSQDPTVALPATIAVLIVTCPCALALATPVALVSALGRFAELGVLPLRMSAMEALASGDALVLDKTGTLTHGKLALSSVNCVGSIHRDKALAYASALERLSEHPVGRALWAAASETHSETGVVVKALENAPGAGVAGTIAGERWRLGSLDFATAGDAPDDEVLNVIADLQKQGNLVAVLARKASVEAVFGFQDAAREGIKEFVSQMCALDVNDITLLSGDHPESVRRFAQRLDLDSALGGQTAADKLAWLTRAQTSGRRVIMVGDGINDAPTLAAADASVSFAEATDLAQGQSDFLVLSNDIRAVSRARALARRTLRIIQGNLLWAAAYNLLAVPAAAMGLVPPWGAALGMSLSSLLVVANSRRLASAKGTACVSPSTQAYSHSRVQTA